MAIKKIYEELVTCKDIITKAKKDRNIKIFNTIRETSAELYNMYIREYGRSFQIFLEANENTEDRDTRLADLSFSEALCEIHREIRDMGFND